MASIVYGTPVTDSTLRGLPEFLDKKITRIDMASAAINLKNAEQKDVNARQFVENLKKNWGVGVSTLCLIYNATGDTIRLVSYKDWYGHIGPSPYPTEIANGQWGAFLHVKTFGGASGSVGAVVYRGKNGDGYECDWLIAWENPWNKSSFRNNVYTKVGATSQMKNINWGDIKSAMARTGLFKLHKNDGCSSTLTMGNFTSPIFEAVLTLY